jgi:hypothetical protein
MTEQVIKIETKISNILFWLCFLITIMAITMYLIEFFSRGGFPSSRIGLFYVGVLAIYSFHKEAIRFLEHARSTRSSKQGEFFVYIWILLTAGLFLLDFLCKNYYSINNNGEALMALTNIAYTAIEVGAVFVIARILKLIMIKFFYKHE